MQVNNDHYINKNSNLHSIKPKNNYQILQLCSKAIHGFQCERACAVGYNESKGKEFEELFYNQLNETNQALETLKEQFKEHASNSKQENLMTLMLVSNNLDIRKRIQDGHTNGEEILESYTRVIIAPIIDIFTESISNSSTQDIAITSALISFIQWKELIGRERAVGLRMFYDHQHEHLQMLRYLIAEQKSNKRTFMALLQHAAHHDAEPIIPPHISPLLEQVHSLITSYKSDQNIISIEPLQWFNLQVDRIDEMQSLELRLIDKLRASARHKKPDHLTQTHSSSEQSVVLDIDKPIPLASDERIVALPLFKDIKVTALNSLLANAHIIEQEPGRMLQIPGERPSRLYIVLNGCIKTFNQNSDGTEAILQISGPGEMVSDSEVFLNTNAYNYTQVIEESTLLSIPAVTVRKSLQQHPRLLNNALQSVAQHTQSLLFQMEQLRLKSAHERVGWFLRKVQNNSVNHSDTFQLPYKKTTIASLLNMTPETFSRVLKRFKEEKIIIHKQTVTLPYSTALCQFCDAKLSKSCANECPEDQLDQANE